ncbi:hypothetical protein DM02DRAFT_662022 [Periconia macrospinosa]|uniref:Uncharacterized protein n=1 Tax=Periconia macrospinosa TaxID=97972 RepID=A0A2V1D5S9_9PLEO|nr:hypothetical protein DM02DRAFT_662022 [Periconia macrospinosa]
MVAFKKLFFATSILLRGVVTAPSRASTLAVTAAVVVNESTIGARNLNNIRAQDKSKPKSNFNSNNGNTPKPNGNTPKPNGNTPNPNGNTPKPETNCRRSRLNRRVLNPGYDANNVAETDWVGPRQIMDNNGKAKVVDLTGCTALFFYMDTPSRGPILRRVVHITAGNEEADAKISAHDAAGSDSVTIGASTSTYFEFAKKGVLAGNSNLRINAQHIYNKDRATATTAVTLSNTVGELTLTEGTGPRVRTELSEDDPSQGVTAC